MSPLSPRSRALQASSFILLAATGSIGFAQVTFAPPGTLSAALRPDGVVAAPLIGSAAPDLAVSLDTPDRVAIFAGAGGGAFAAPIDVLTGAGTGPGALAAADFDGDTDVDVAVALKGVDQVRLVRNQGGVMVLDAGGSAVGATPVWIAAGDIDGDNDVDMLVANRDGDSVTVLRNAGNGTFAATTLPAGSEPRRTALGRFDADALPDLVVTNNRDRNIGVYTNLGGGAFSAAVLYTVGPDVRPDGVTTGDLDRDGDVDIAVATSGNVLNRAAVFTNNAGTFSGPVNYTTGGVNPDTIVAVDLTCEGALDLVVSNQDSGNLTVLRNTGTGAFAAAQLFAAGTRPGTLTAADMDADQLADVVVGNRDSNDLSVFINTTCQPRQPGDMNCDGAVDFFDIDPFLLALFDPAGYAEQFPSCNILNGDMQSDGLVNFFDIDPFVACLFGACP